MSGVNLNLTEYEAQILLVALGMLDPPTDKDAAQALARVAKKLEKA